jgi:hypothetical protein
MAVGTTGASGADVATLLPKILPRNLRTQQLGTAARRRLASPCPFLKLILLAVSGIFFSRFRCLALVLFDDGISRLRGWGYNGYVPWLLNYGVHAGVV